MFLTSEYILNDESEHGTLFEGYVQSVGKSVVFIDIPNVKLVYVNANDIILSQRICVEKKQLPWFFFVAKTKTK